MARGSSWWDGVSYSRLRWVRASAPAGCSPRGPGGVGLLLQGLFPYRAGGFCRVCRAPECEFGSLGCRKSPRASARSKRATSSGPRASFSFGRRGGVCQATLGGRAVTPPVVAGKAPEPLLGARGRSGVFLSFLCGPRASFSFGRRGGVCQATLSGREQ